MMMRHSLVREPYTELGCSPMDAWFQDGCCEVYEHIVYKCSTYPIPPIYMIATSSVDARVVKCYITD